MDRDVLQAHLEDGHSLERIGEIEGRHPSTVAYWLKRHGLTANGHEAHSPRGGIDREVLEALVNAGLTQRQIAAELGRSQATIKHWLRRHGLRTAATRTLRSRGGESAPGRVTRTCRRHGATEFALEGRGYYRCCRCRSEAVTAARQRNKKELVEAAGGCCILCGYDRYYGALHFHHLEPEEKKFALSHRGLTRARVTRIEEAKKCVLICANCHAEIEAGVTELPIELLNRIRPK
jgi:transposase